MEFWQALQGLGTFLTACVALMTWRQSRATQVQTKATHELVNGVSHDLATAQIGRARAEGHTEGEQAQRDREG